VPDRRSLPPMEATEFAIDAAFRHCFFALGLLVGWLVVLAPFAALVWFTGFRNGPPDFKALTPAAIAALALLALVTVIASFSIAVNWNRRILAGERPRFWQRWRVDAPVWRYLGGVILILVVLGLYAGAGAGVMLAAVPALAASLGAAAKPIGIVLTVLIGLSGLFSLYRLMSWLPGVVLRERGPSLATVWRATRGNRRAFLGFTFWLLFSLAIAAGLGAGAFFAQQALPQPWVKPAAFALMAVIGWLAVLMLHAVPAALHRAFR